MGEVLVELCSMRSSGPVDPQVWVKTFHVQKLCFDLQAECASCHDCESWGVVWVWAWSVVSVAIE